MSRVSSYALALGALVILATVIGVSAINRLPPDEHEVLVLRTTQEMQARGDWVVPYFNGEPRLKKPPMNYWLTGLVAALAGAGGTIEVWHGRLPSLLAGLGMTLLSGVAGRHFYGARAALYAAALFVTTAGYFSYVHDARPDFVYAWWCTLGLFSGAMGLLGLTRAPTLHVYLMWLAFGLATLTKGPQIPLMLLVAAAIFTQLRAMDTPGIRALHPVGGIALLAAVTLPWWAVLQHRLDPSTVNASQLSGRLLIPRLTKVLNGYYFYRPLQLVLPWLPLFPAAWAAAWASGAGRSKASVFLGLAVICVATGLSFGGQQRYFYMLPVLPAMCLLAGHGIERMEGLWPRLTRIIWPLQGLVIVGCVAWLYFSQGQWPLLAALLPGAGVAGFVVSRVAGTRTAGVTAALVLVIGVTFARFADGEVFWSADRRNKHEIASQLAAKVPRSALLVTLKLTPEVYVFAAGRRIPKLTSGPELGTLMTERGVDQAYVLMEVAEAPALTGYFQVEEVMLMPRDANDRAGLYRLSNFSARHNDIH